MTAAEEARRINKELEAEYLAQVAATMKSPKVNNANGNDNNSENEESGEEQSDTYNLNSNNLAKGREGRSSVANNPKRVIRSVSPPSNKRVSASWKMDNPEELSSLRSEVLSAHVPKDDDEWMQREMEVLTQFTRIFPVEKKSDKDADKEDDEVVVGAGAGMFVVVFVIMKGLYMYWFVYVCEFIFKLYVEFYR